jgi:hypothetical protein
MTELHKYGRLIIGGIILIVIAWIISPALKSGDTHIYNHIHTDTITKQTYTPPVIIPNNAPVKVTIYLKPDTALRKTLEKDPIIEDVKVKKGEVDITTVNDSGQVKTEVHKLSKENKETDINSKGNVKDKEKTKTGIAIQKVAKRAKDVIEVVAIVYTFYKLLTGKL